MPLVPLQIPPGVARNGTKYQVKGRWYDASLMRWYEGVMQPVGGWSKVQPTALTGKARGILAWRDNSSNRRMVIGTHSKLYTLSSTTLQDITPVGFTSGAADSSVTTAYGSGTFGTGFYGVPRNILGGGVTEATTWSFSTWGENVLGVSSADGKLYEWAPPTITPATAVANAPTGNTGVLVTSERIVMLLGAGGDKRKVQWSDQENNTIWTSTALNSAGDFSLETNGRIRTAYKVRGQNLILTDVDAHVAQYVGQPFIYGFERVGTGCGIAGNLAGTATSDFAVWMSQRGFWMFDGYVKPVPCEVEDYVFHDINFDQAAKICASHVSEFGEVWWYYPSQNSTENDRYVVWNYRENHWTIGSLMRTCMCDRGAFPNPIAVDADGYAYFHEYGYTADATARIGDVYATSAPIEIGAGDQVMVCKQLLPDEKTAGAAVEVTFATQFTTEGSERTYGPYSCGFTDGYTDVRFTGRQIAMTVTNVADEYFRVGTFRLEVSPGGRR